MKTPSKLPHPSTWPKLPTEGDIRPFFRQRAANHFARAKELIRHLERPDRRVAALKQLQMAFNYLNAMHDPHVVATLPN